MKKRPGWITQERLNSLLVFVLLLASYAYTFPRWADWNQNSHFDLVFAIVNHGTLSIDCCVQNTGDYAIFEGHTYTDKAPGMSFLGLAPAYVFKGMLALKPVASLMTRAAQNPALAATLRADGTGLLADKIQFALGLTFVTFFVVCLPAALLGVLLYRFLGRFVPSAGYRLLVTLIYGLLSVAFPYANTFYSHQLVAALLFAAFVLIFGFQDAGPGWARLTLIGLLMAYSIITEYPTVIIAGLLFCYCLYRMPDRRQIVWVLVGGLLPGVLASAYNYAIFHTPLPVGYHYSALWQNQHSTGFMSLTYPKVDALWGILFSPYRGLFFYSPVLLLALPGFIYLWRRRTYRIEALVSALGVLGFLAFNSASAMWWGGFAVGARYVIPMLPFMAWPMIFFFAEHGRKAWARILTVVLAVISFVLLWGLSLAGQAFPEETWSFPWLGYALPHLAAGDLARNVGMLVGLRGWWSLAPLVALFVLVAVVWSGILRPQRIGAAVQEIQSRPGGTMTN
jgi:hypothetical protein